MKIVYIAIILASIAVGANATQSNHLIINEKICNMVRSMVQKYGIDEAIRLAKARGYSESAIRAASVCL